MTLVGRLLYGKKRLSVSLDSLLKASSRNKGLEELCSARLGRDVCG